jgi:hypothetical protein
MTTQKNRPIRTHELIYIISRNQGESSAVIKITFYHKPTAAKYMSLSWEHGRSKESHHLGWGNCSFNVKLSSQQKRSYNQFERLHRIGITFSSTFKQALEVLQASKIQQGLHVVLDQLYEGFLSSTEIEAGTFRRNNKQIKISSEQQKLLQEELKNAKIITKPTMIS